MNQQTNGSLNQSVVHIALYAAVIAVLSYIPPVHLAFLGGTPITAQNMGIMLAGVMLGPIRGAVAVILFLGVVALGGPFLSGGRGGLAVFYSPWAGFLFGWPIAAFATGCIMRATRGWKVVPAAFMASVIGCIAVLYVIGVPYLAYRDETPLLETFYLCLVLVPGDLLKAALAAIVADTVARGLPRAVLSRT